MASIPDRIAALEEKVVRLRGEMLQVVEVLALMYGASYGVHQHGIVSPESVHKAMSESAVHSFEERRDRMQALRAQLEDEME